MNQPTRITVTNKAAMRGEFFCTVDLGAAMRCRSTHGLASASCPLPSTRALGCSWSVFILSSRSMALPVKRPSRALKNETRRGANWIARITHYPTTEDGWIFIFGLSVCSRMIFECSLLVPHESPFAPVMPRVGIVDLQWFETGGGQERSVLGETLYRVSGQWLTRASAGSFHLFASRGMSARGS